MAKKLFVAIACGVGLVNEANAETWRVRLVPVPEKSLSTCTADVSQAFYDLTLEGTTFSGKSSVGTGFSTQVGADGMFKVAFTGVTGPLEVSGNVRTKDIQVVNTKYSCTFKFVPM